jgi:adenosylcobinamide kinase/adenosylcobinamide-phosphate guanylyltransferase
MRGVGNGQGEGSGLGYTLVLGGARSGKSAYALASAEAAARGREGARLVMIATAQPLDDEMSERIARHRAERGRQWATIEAPMELPEAVASLAPTDLAVVDCVTLWLSNVMLAEGDIDAGIHRLEAALRASQTDLWIVSNEVGFGIVPDNALARRFRDCAGQANQRLASKADIVQLVVAGCPIQIRGQ